MYRQRSIPLAITITVFLSHFANPLYTTAGPNSPSHPTKQIFTSTDPVPPAKPLDRLFNLPTLQNNPNAKGIQHARLIGRIHTNQVWHDSQQGNHKEFEFRRTRLGLHVDFLRDLTFHSDANLTGFDNRQNIEFTNIETATLTYHPKHSPNSRFLLGKQKIPLTREYNQPSANLPTVERSHFVNQLAPRFLWGAAWKQSWENGWSTHLGTYFGDAEGNSQSKFGNAGSTALLRIDKSFNVDNHPLDYADIQLHLFYNDRHPNNNAVAPFDWIISLSHEARIGPLSLWIDLISATGDSNPYGFVILPTYNLITFPSGQQWQLAARYAWSNGNGNASLLTPRYEFRATNIPYLNRYQSAYLGLNYIIQPAKLSLQFGVEFAQAITPDNLSFNSTSFLIGTRFTF